MIKNTLGTLLIFAAAALSLACGGGATNTSNTANANLGTTVLDPANMPPGLSASPLPVNGTPIPGIPTNGQPLPKGTTPTPGIPSPEELKKGVKKGATPTPGIPDPETLRKSMGRSPNNANVKPPANVPMMRSTNRPN
jgi:hypothetical protein